ncbi:Oidioi.mRNA.OKI2018_I69.PAR.g12143.t1.cds [Oikopleura dioica]|uniref:Oidioi.mRNA.OKI2018_I69.PAR.g12143.t1.cds n=1 Tax=Oikopleura dioica TaxID=34765 RepID=A0ABN7S204_OIKDI|nr:Oidioi.mRNA.OKI2018_I69.PAR.g12143.t1.cds [Oikopleura dioica]
MTLKGFYALKYPVMEVLPFRDQKHESVVITEPRLVSETKVLLDNKILWNVLIGRMPITGTAKIEILDPKLIIVERKENVKKPRNVFKLNYDHPDVKDIKKYGKVTTTRDHCKK